MASAWHEVLIIEKRRNHETVGLLFNYDTQFTDGHATVTIFIDRLFRSGPYVAEAFILFFKHLFSSFSFRKIYLNTYEYNEAAKPILDRTGEVKLEGFFHSIATGTDDGTPSTGMPSTVTIALQWSKRADDANGRGWAQASIANNPKEGGTAVGSKSSDGGWFHEAKMRSDGKTDNYFGRRGSSDYSHVVVNESGRVEYACDAGERSPARS